MKIRNGLVVGLLLVAASSMAAKIPWSKNFKNAMAEAKKEHKVVMIDVFTTWCYWCKRLDSDTYPNPAVVKAAAQFIPVKLDAEHDPAGVAVAKKYTVQGYPTLLFLNGSGKLVYQIVGFEEPAAFVKSLDKAATFPKRYAAARAAASANSKSWAAQMNLFQLDEEIGDKKRSIADYNNMKPLVNSSNRRDFLSATLQVAEDEAQGIDPKDSIPLFATAIENGTPAQVAEAQFYVSMAYYRVGDLGAAIKSLKAVVAMGPIAAQYTKDAQDGINQFEKMQTAKSGTATQKSGKGSGN